MEDDAFVLAITRLPVVVLDSKQVVAEILPWLWQCLH